MTPGKGISWHLPAGTYFALHTIWPVPAKIRIFSYVLLRVLNSVPVEDSDMYKVLTKKGN